MSCEFPYPNPVAIAEPPTVLPSEPGGDLIPHHLLMPEVAWPAPVGPVIRMWPRREHWLLENPARQVDSLVFEPEPDPLNAIEFSRTAGVVAFGTWCVGAVLLVGAHLMGWLK